ncbi:hypothetical protein [Pelagibius marinus]|uniref:hypothetical protein n=1 Tax=Pelagibius marinus TaxID=2762760 RepID=UPI00187279FD|nr:hypothetical protein [Pelagibius marinus]
MSAIQADLALVTGTLSFNVPVGFAMLLKALRAGRACVKLGIAVAPGTAIAVGTGIAPSGVRIAYSASDLNTWVFALDEVARIAREAPAARWNY